MYDCPSPKKKDTIKHPIHFIHQIVTEKNSHSTRNCFIPIYALLKKA